MLWWEFYELGRKRTKLKHNITFEQSPFLFSPQSDLILYSGNIFLILHKQRYIKCFVVEKEEINVMICLTLCFTLQESSHVWWTVTVTLMKKPGTDVSRSPWTAEKPGEPSAMTTSTTMPPGDLIYVNIKYLSPKIAVFLWGISHDGLQFMKYAWSFLLTSKSKYNEISH